VFWQTPGVYSTAVGYSGGETKNPTYEEVCTGFTNHTEAVLVVFDPKVVTYEELLKVPTARDPWSVLQLVPGVQLDRVNVGGSESGQQSTFVSKGDSGDNTTWNIDGVNVTDMGAIGSSASYYDFGSIEEVQVQTGGSDVGQMTGGVGINIVTKRGSNEFHGSGRGVFTNDSLQNNNIDDDLANSPVNPDVTFGAQKVDQILEIGGEVGGPVLKDRLWFWGAANRNKIDNITISGVADKTKLINYSGKLSGQLTDTNEANVFYTFADKVKKGRSASTTRPPETTFNQGGGTPILKIEDQQIFGSDALLSAKYAHVGGGFHLYPQGGSLEGGPALMANQDYDTGLWANNFYHYETNRPQDMGFLDASYFKSIGNLDNDFKFGFSYRDTPVDTHLFWDQGGYVYYNAIAGGFSEEFDTVLKVSADLFEIYEQKTISAYASDTITTGNFTFDLGLRFDRQTAKNGEAVRAENPLAPQIFSELVYEGDDGNLIEWTNVAPRVGASYQLGESTLLKANYSFYADQLPGAALVAPLNPFGGAGYTYFYSYFDDVNGDHIFNPGSEHLIVQDGAPCGGICGGGTKGFDPENPNALTAINEIDPDLKAPTTNEVVLGLTQQVGRDVTVGVNFTARRRTGDTWQHQLVVDEAGNRRTVQFDDYVVAGTVNGDPKSGDFAGDFETPGYSITYYTLRDGLEFASGAIRTENRPDYHQQYLGAELVFQKRFSNRWSLGANLTLNDWTEHFDVGGEGDMDPNRSINFATGFINPGVDGGAVAVRSTGSGSKGSVYMNSKWQSNLRGSYTIPKVEVDFGGSLLFRQGYLSPFYDSVRTAIPGDSGTTKNMIAFGDIDEFRMDDVVSLDLHLGKSFNFTDSVGLEVGADVFNVFNSATILQHQLRIDSSTFLEPQEVLGPRLLRLSARARF
jgi:hypothetical protein